jgi:hypothetical protein
VNLIDDVLLLPDRAHWHLTHWKNLSRRERRRLRRSPALLSQQRAWVEAFPKRLSAAMKRVYGGSIRDHMPPDHPLTRTFDCDFTFPPRFAPADSPYVYLLPSSK